MALDGVARSSVFLGDLEVAAAHAQAARTLAAPLSLPLLLADTLNTSALIASETRDLGQAETLFTQALDLHGQVHHHHGITLNLTGLAWNALLAGEFARCAALSRRVLRRAEDSAQRWEIGNALLNLGHAQLAGDLPGNPQDLFRQAREIAGSATRRPWKPKRSGRGRVPRPPRAAGAGAGAAARGAGASRHERRGPRVLRAADRGPDRGRLN